uniref:Uncharacterized protein n=1 Tax=Schistocephalus solidus TaxID=70667 RepID=A0A0X3PJ35_SCHSO
MSDLEDLLQQVRRNFIASDDSTTCEILCESFDALCAEDSSSNSGSENFASNGSKRRKSPEIPPPRVLGTCFHFLKIRIQPLGLGIGTEATVFGRSAFHFPESSVS